MKSSKFSTFILLILTLLSIVLAYFLIIDFPTFQRFMWKEDYEQVNNPNSETDKAQEAQFYKPTTLTLTDTLLPIKYIYRNSNETKQIYNQDSIKEINTLIANTPIYITNDRSLNDEDFINSLYEKEHFQVVYADLTPLKLLTNYFDTSKLKKDDLMIDRVVIDLSKENMGQVFLINSKTNEYVRAESQNANTLKKTLDMDQEILMKVEGYVGYDELIYLPKEPLSINSETYTLEKLPESLFVKSFFPNGDYKTNENSEKVTVYFNYQYTLEFSDNKQLLNVRVSRPDKKEHPSIEGKFNSPFNIFSQYEYWKNTIHLMKSSSNLMEFRRFINSRPIFMKTGMNEYAASQFNLRNDASSEIYHFQIPMLIFHAHILDQRKPVEIQSADQIETMLKIYGYDIRNFDDIILGYEWQEETEDNQKAILIPKWYFRMNNHYYSWDDIATNKFRSDWSKRMEGGD